jgi:hypothetical protein
MDGMKSIMECEMDMDIKNTAMNSGEKWFNILLKEANMNAPTVFT